MDVFTSITMNYLPKARILAHSLKRQHPDWRFHVCIADRSTPEFDLAQEPFDEVVWIEDLDIPNLFGWIFKHTVVEICTAVKGYVLWRLLNRGAEKVIYLDPDIAVFNSLSQLDTLLDQHAVLLTPHLIDPEEEHQAIQDNEITALKYGVFNLGFVAVSNTREGRAFARWWRERLFHYCYDDLPNGLFTDQRWCDLVPALFDKVCVVRDPGYNVASWNLTQRHVSMSSDGMLLVNDVPLRFYHFTGYDAGIGFVMTQRYSGGNLLIDELWTWYRLQIEQNGQAAYGAAPWYFGTYANGEKIRKEDRLLYRSRLDLQRVFPNPFVTETERSFYSWLIQNI